LQKRIDALKAEQEELEKFTKVRTLSELEHYRFAMMAGIGFMVFVLLFAFLLGLFFYMLIYHRLNAFQLIESFLFFLLLSTLIYASVETSFSKALKFWRAASPWNRAEMQKRIDDLQKTLTERMAKRFGWSTKPR
jgi:high-affinity Fe2+/Pb2+ permease